MKLLYAFLASTLFIILVVTSVKNFSSPTQTVAKKKKAPSSFIQARESLRLKGPKGIVHLASKPVLVKEFQKFCETTGYVTLNERLEISPNWKSGSPSPSDYVKHLNKEDILAYLYYLNHPPDERHSYSSLSQAPHLSPIFRLPYVEELKKLPSSCQVETTGTWEWTQSTLKEVDPFLPNSKDYLSFWHFDATRQESEVAYLRERDLRYKEIHQVVFRIAWSPRFTKQELR